MEKFKVFVAGTTGAGKTAFLASLYNRLSTTSTELGFHLETSTSGSNALNNKYREMINPDEPWPEGTRDIERWDFACKSWSHQQVLFEFSYLDFPGAVITDSEGHRQAEEFNVGEKVKDANSLLFLLDGQKVYYFMQDIDPPTGHSLMSDLDALLSLAMRAKTDAPLHFVLTKWDILEENYTLAQVKERLFAVPKFINVIQTRQEAKLPTRLIPVSAFGRGFARLDENGRMIKKQSGVIPIPYQVELSIACTLIDGFRVAHERIKQEKAISHTNKLALTALLFRMVTCLMRCLGFGARQLNEALSGPYQLGTKACALLVDSATRRMELKSQELDAEIEKLQESIDEKESALHTAIKKCDLLSLHLERDYPASNLTSL